MPFNCSHTNMDRTYPVLIGTIPLNPNALADNRGMPSAPPIDTYPSSMPGDYNNFSTNPYLDSSKPGYAPPNNPYLPPTHNFPTTYPPSTPMPVPGLSDLWKAFKIKFFTYFQRSNFHLLYFCLFQHHLLMTSAWLQMECLKLPRKSVLSFLNLYIFTRLKKSTAWFPQCRENFMLNWVHNFSQALF